MRFSKAVVKHRVPILICALLLMIPSVLGMAGTRVNYDILNYLPEDMDTVLWYDSVAYVSVPMELTPDKLYDAFNSGDATMMAVFFDTSTSS